MSDNQQSPVTPPEPSGPQGTPAPPPRRRSRRVGTAALVAGGLVAGGVLGGTLSAVASNDGSPSSAVSSAAQAAEPGAPSGQGYGMQAPPSGEDGETLTPSGEADGQRDESQSQRSDETLLTGETAEKVEAAALAQYPGATVLRVETDSDGVYEAHLVTADGQRVTVAVGEDFTVTGVQEMGDGGHRGRGPGGPAGGGSDATSPDGQAVPDGQGRSDGFASPDASDASGQQSGLSS